MRVDWTINQNDYLALTIFLVFLCFLMGCFLLFNKEALRVAAFPLFFLIFMVPMPLYLQNGIEVFFQQSSAIAAELMLNLSGATVLRQGMELHLPGMKLLVAQECSGIHSSLVLFITSLVAGHLFLRSPWKKAVLAIAVIPLAVLRNGFRIFIIAQLCLRISPDMIDSRVHRHGGPLFFALSLIPFFLLLLWLRKSESRF